MRINGHRIRLETDQTDTLRLEWGDRSLQTTPAMLRGLFRLATLKRLLRESFESEEVSKLKSAIALDANAWVEEKYPQSVQSTINDLLH